MPMPLRLRPRLGVLCCALAIAASLFTAVPARAELLIRDDTGHELRLARPAERIVSLAPHVTELLYAAGAGAHVVGAVAYSDFPEAARKLPRVGGYSNVDMEAIAALKPDLVIAWKSGNRDSHLDKLAALGIPVYMSEPRRLEDVAHSLENIGRLAGTDKAARAAADAFRARKAALAERYSQRPRVRMFYQIWNKPLMTINDEHLISDVIRLCGGENVFGGLSELAPTIGVESVLAADPEVIVASGMGEARPDWLDYWKRWPKLAAIARDNLYFIPPELIQRHTPRILDGATMLCEQLEDARRKRRGAK
ncbi:cobalamin-binding protein [Azoarcus sp. DN11]|nr:cobalamin-binding protein [Azoarcus sp. DN11]